MLIWKRLSIVAVVLLMLVGSSTPVAASVAMCHYEPTTGNIEPRNVASGDVADRLAQGFTLMPDNGVCPEALPPPVRLGPRPGCIEDHSNLIPLVLNYSVSPAYTMQHRAQARLEPTHEMLWLVVGDDSGTVVVGEPCAP